MTRVRRYVLTQKGSSIVSNVIISAPKEKVEGSAAIAFP